MSNIMAVTYEDAIAVTTSDTVADPNGPFAALLVLAAGTVKFTSRSGTVAITGSVPAGTIINVYAKQVWTTGTSATVMGLIAFPYKRTTPSV